MTQPIAYEDAVDLLDADHKAVKKLFIRYAALCDDGADVQEKRMVAERICQDLTIHAQIEEEIFYPAVREIIGDDSMMDKALEEHAEAKEAIAQIQEMDSTDQGYGRNCQTTSQARRPACARRA
jgi:hemerythrin superfamily protein